MNMRLLGLFTVIALASACSSESKPPPRVADAVVAESAPPRPVAAPAAPAQSTALKVSEDIRSACALPEPQAYFGYNSSKVRQSDTAFLKKLAQCLTTGPLKKRQMRIVGHADPRGSDAFNHALAESRAKSVKMAMVGLGLPVQQAQTESRGKRDAVGVSEEGWAKDRRVEVSLLQ